MASSRVTTILHGGPPAGDLQVLWPPAGPHAGDFAGRPEMVLVVVRTPIRASSDAIFGQDDATVTTGAVAARETTSANSNSLVALDPTSCAAGKTHGNGRVVIEPVENPETGVPYSGGYIHVNSACGSGAYNNACGKRKRRFQEVRERRKPDHRRRTSTSTGHVEVNGGTMTSPVTEGAPQIGDPLAGLRRATPGGVPGGPLPRSRVGR